jgi:Tfp pilus assembly protein PilF
LLADQGAYQNALDVLNTSLRQGTADVDTLTLAAGLHYKLKQFTSSVSRYREALALQPQRGVLWMGLGLALEHNLQTTDALDAYRRASNTALEIKLQNFVTGRITALSGRTD